MAVTPKLNITLNEANEVNGHVRHNQAMNVLDALVHLAIEDRDLATPPGSPTNGQAYLVAGSPTGAWTGHAGDIAYYYSGWYFTTPLEGMTARVKDENISIIYDGAAWATFGGTSTVSVWKQSVKVATTANGTLATAFENGDTVDGVALTTGDRILIKDQSSGTENGIYVVAASGAPTRATDADAGSELVNACVFVEQGTVNADRAFVCTNNSITIGATSITFVGFSSVVVNLTGPIASVGNATSITSQSGTGTKFLMAAGPVFDAQTASANTAPKWTSGTLNTTAEAGAIEYDGTCFYSSPKASERGVIPSEYFICLSSVNNLANSALIQPIFDSVGAGQISLPVGTYFFDSIISISAMSGTSGNASIDLLGGGTAVLGTLLYDAIGLDNAINTLGNRSGATLSNNATPQPAVTAGTNTALQIHLSGTFRVTTAGTLIPSITLANAAAAVVAAGSYLRLHRVGDQNVQTVGPWS